MYIGKKFKTMDDRIVHIIAVNNWIMLGWFSNKELPDEIQGGGVWLLPEEEDVRFPADGDYDYQGLTNLPDEPVGPLAIHDDYDKLNLKEIIQEG